MMKKNKHQGISLLELMLSLAIIAILLVMATRYYQITRQSQQVEEGLELMTSIYTAGSSYLESNPSFSGVTLQTFINNGSVPASFKNSATINPWGGALTVTGSAQNLVVGMTNIPDKACNNLDAKVKQKFGVSTSSCNNNTYSYTLTFERR